MKKSLLLSVAMLAALPVFAATDGDIYAPVNGIKIQNAWVLDRNHTETAYTTTPACNTNTRTAAIKDGVIYASCWAANDDEAVNEKGDKLNAATVYKYSVETGEYLGAIKVTLDGKRYTGTGVINQIGVDNFGNVWCADMSLNTAAATDLNLFTLDVTTGALTKVAALTKNGTGLRIDYCDLVGDVTGVQAPCTVIAAGSSSQMVFGWCRDKGGAEWYGYFENSVNKEFTEFYPKDNLGWGTAPVAKVLLGEGEDMYYGSLFYIDGFQQKPTLYNSTGSIADSFENATELAPGDNAANGICEFSVDGKDFIAFPIGQYQASYQCKVRICEMGEGMAFKGMAQYWEVPNSGLGTTSDGGTRVHNIIREYKTNADGTQYVNLVSFKCYNGIALYQIGKNLPDGVSEATADKAAAEITVNGNVITVSEEAAEINVYNVAGQVVATAKNATEVAAPAAGAYIVKAVVAGAPVVKKVVL